MGFSVFVTYQWFIYSKNVLFKFERQATAHTRTVTAQPQAIAGQADARSDIDMDGMELDNNCLVLVGSAGAGGVALDERTPAEKQNRDPRRRSRKQWEGRLAVVDSYPSAGIKWFVLRVVMGRSQEVETLLFDQMPEKDGASLRQRDSSHACVYMNMYI